MAAAVSVRAPNLPSAWCGACSGQAGDPHGDVQPTEGQAGGRIARSREGPGHPVVGEARRSSEDEEVEVAGLKWSDLDRPTSRLSISRTLQSLAGQPVEFPVKTRTSRRCIDLDEQTMDVLVRWRRRLAREGLPHGIDDWMFVNTTGRFVNPESLSQLFDRVQRGMPELTRIRFHDLRHTHASLLIMAGEATKVVTERLGHSTPAFTIHTYQHLLPGMSAAAAERFAALIATPAR